MCRDRNANHLITSRAQVLGRQAPGHQKPNAGKGPRTEVLFEPGERGSDVELAQIHFKLRTRHGQGRCQRQGSRGSCSHARSPGGTQGVQRHSQLQLSWHQCSWVSVTSRMWSCFVNRPLPRAKGPGNKSGVLYEGWRSEAHRTPNRLPSSRSSTAKRSSPLRRAHQDLSFA